MHDCQAHDIVAIALALADEGVPLAAIARAVRVPAAQLRETFEAAVVTGDLTGLPRADWPPGFPRDQRALQLSRIIHENKRDFIVAVQQLLGITKVQINILLSLLQHPSFAKDATRTSNSLEVHISRLRRALAPYNVQILTCWGYGYKLSTDDRRKILDLLLDAVNK